jgi:CheY-like chemotaxis protein
MPGSTDVFSARILIVDDQDSCVRLLEHTLRRGGYTAVSSTPNPLEVCARHREHRYDLILLDIQMPRMNGFEVLAGLRSAPDDDPVAILVLTADPAQMVRALESGATGFLSKPFVLAEVLRCVGVMLEVGFTRDPDHHRGDLRRRRGGGDSLVPEAPARAARRA